MKKVFYELSELLPEMTTAFTAHAMFDALDEGDMISILPFEDTAKAVDFVAQTNQLLANHFDVHDELCYSETSYLDNDDNPLLFWKDYLNCFYNVRLVEDEASKSSLSGTSFGLYEIVGVNYIDEVNKRLKLRRLNGIRLEYKVKATPMDRNKHWNRTYDKDF